MFQIFNLTDQFLVVSEKWCARLKLTIHQRFTNKNLTCFCRMRQTVLNTSLTINDQSVYGCPLKRGALSSFLLPTMLTVGFFQQMAADLFQPLRLNLCNATTI